MLGLIFFILSFPLRRHNFYNALVRSKLEYLRVGWNSTSLTDSSELQTIQRKCAASGWSRLLVTLADVTLH
jgi:hypothetical protein